jgi:3D (Asp-Asp-Asp) domain-containing protein
MRLLGPALSFAFLIAGCAGAVRPEGTIESPWNKPTPPVGAESVRSAGEPAAPVAPRGASLPPGDRDDSIPQVVLAEEPAAPIFRNTYYDFPREGVGAKDSTVFDATCAPIARVTTEFHDRVCVQGSGRLASGATVSFAKRGCSCAAVCPRSGQQICYERLDPARFPSGRGALGKPITPLRTVAVDSRVIPLGTSIFVSAYVGLPRPDGTRHDGCFVAEDRGIRVIGRQIDVFTGDPALTAQWNALVPSNRGVQVVTNDARCRRGG